MLSKVHLSEAGNDRTFRGVAIPYAQEHVSSPARFKYQGRGHCRRKGRFHTRTQIPHLPSQSPRIAPSTIVMFLKIITSFDMTT